jgi:transporter family-2 protein
MKKVGPPMAYHALVMLLAGVGIPILAALNARLGANIGSPAAAALLLFLVAFCATGLVVLTTGTGAFARLAGIAVMALGVALTQLAGRG